MDNVAKYVSTESRSKLKAYQFINGEPAPDALKPNLGETDRKSGEANVTCAVEEEPIESGPDRSQSTKPYPSTPSARLPFGEVDCNASRNHQSIILSTTPEEYIGWSTILSPKDNGSLDFTGGKKLKRNRSSSPLHSSQGEPGHRRRTKPAGQLETTPNPLRTPRADPAIDLWTKYTTDKANVNAAVKPRPLKSVSLLGQSPPRPHGEDSTRKVGGLRRWASCGVEWPTSRAKRRKTKAGTRGERIDILQEHANPQEIDKKETVTTSKLGFLVERMQETLARNLGADNAPPPSSSSPFPKAGEAQAADSKSPCQHLGRGAQRLENRDEDDDDSEKYRLSDFKSPRKSHGRYVEAGSHQQKVPVTLSAAAALGRDVLKTESDDYNEEGFLADELESFASLYDNRPDDIPLDLPTGRTKNEKADLEIKESPIEIRKAAQATFLSSDDDYGGVYIDAEQCAAVEAIATQKLSEDKGSQFTSEGKAKLINRYRISNVFDGSYSVNNHDLPEKILVLEEEHAKVTKAINLRQSWYNTAYSIGFYVHVTGERREAGLNIVDDTDGILVLHPDHLISVTSIADSFGCVRRAVLQDRVKATSAANVPQVLGHILHELFQKALKSNRWDTAWMEATLSSMMPNYYESIIAIGVSIDGIQAQLREKVGQLQSWANIYVGDQPKPDAFVKDRSDQRARMSVNKLLDVEEHIWSPKFGMKGNIDVTAEATVIDDQGRNLQTLPLELKTGKNNSSVSHQAQTALYTLLLSSRYDVDIAFGILYYVESSETIRIPAIRRELLQMIMRRNELASYLRMRSELPPVLNNSHMCRKCYAQTSCFVYHKLSEDGTGEMLAPKAEYAHLVRNLTKDDQAFFKKWDDLLTKEESEMMRFRRELWSMTSEHREKLGRCFSNVLVEPGSDSEKQDGSRISRFFYSFVKPKGAEKYSFLDSQISAGEPIVVSDERGHFALANGYAINVQKDRVTVAVDRELKNRPYGKPELGNNGRQITQPSNKNMQLDNGSTNGRVDGEGILYRVDKDEFSNGMALVRKNLIQIMLDDVFRARALRSLVVHTRPPLFRTDEDGPSNYSQCTYDMNPDQRAAVDKVMRAKDYALVLGMPGTGKTTTIAQIIKHLVSNGKSVLLTSYTHTAVDNILLKLQDTGISILRLGAIAKIHPGVQELVTLAAKPKATLDEVKDSWFNPPVVATTCLGIKHQIFSERIFDYCIVDEASQITLPVCLGPIRMAQTFILVGDHYQLPPLVQNKQAMEGGLDVSLFKILSENHPKAVVTLEHQYRMCADIMLLANTLIYDGRLKCGNDDVAQKKLEKVNFQGLKAFHQIGPESKLKVAPQPLCLGNGQSCWLQDLMAPEARVRFINTDTVLPLPLESITGQRIINQVEAMLTSQLVTSLINVGVSGSDIGVITFYRSQLALLKQSVHHTDVVEMYTADRFQGRDKEVIVVSCVRSNSRSASNKKTHGGNKEDAGQVGDLLRDWRRVNVAITRARSKLIIIGSVRTLRMDDVLRKLIDLCTDQGWLYNLPPDATKSHIFPATNHSDDPYCSSSAPSVERSTKQRQKQKSKPTRTVLGVTQGKAERKVSSTKGSQRKSGHLTAKSVLGSRPVLKDIVNEILDESFD